MGGLGGAPNVALPNINGGAPNINGGTAGLYAIDPSSQSFYMATLGEGNFFTLGLAAINLTTGSSYIIGNNWPTAPAGFEGVNGLFFSVDAPASLWPSSSPRRLPRPPAAGAGFIVCGFAYASAANALVSFEFNAAAFSKNRGWIGLPNAEIALYPVNGSGRLVIATLPAGVMNPVAGQVDVTSDGRFVFFGGTQGSNVFEAPALVTIDSINRTLSIALAPSPDVDDYNVLALSRCN